MRPSDFFDLLGIRRPPGVADQSEKQLLEGISNSKRQQNGVLMEEKLKFQTLIFRRLIPTHGGQTGEKTIHKIHLS